MNKIITLILCLCCAVTREVTSVKGKTLEVNGGVQNIFDAYQSDFDRDKNRDSAYIYGPATPRSYFAGVKISF